MTEEEKKKRINQVNDFMYDHGFCNVYNDKPVKKLYIADLLESARREAYSDLLNELCIGCAYLRGTECANKICPCQVGQLHIVQTINKLLNKS